MMTAIVGVIVVVGIKVGMVDSVAVVAVVSSHHEVGLGEAATVGGEGAVLATQNSPTLGSSSGFSRISWHVGSVRTSPSNMQVAAPSLIDTRVVSPSASISIWAGMFKSAIEQVDVESSYECFWAVNSRVPSRNVTCKCGKVCGFCTSITAPGLSSNMLPSPVENWAPSTGSAMIRPVSWMAMSTPLSNVVHSESSGHCICAFPADRCSFR